MIKFIDLNTGNIFSGEQPYCFWFDEGQSVRINYVKHICVLSDKSTLNVSLKNEGIFNLININGINSTSLKINNFNYKDLTNLLEKNIQDGFIQQQLKGYKYNNYYIYMLYVYASSLDAGSYKQFLNIDGEDFLIGADFYNENETLKSNVQNFGLDLPDAIQKTIYDSNIHEEAKDNILMNRKYKELLIEYKDILAQKGSYNSLIKSLGWFEYGDLVKIQEYWRNNNSHRDLNRKDLSPMITDELFNSLNTYVKTTYIGLYLALNKIKLNDDGELIYKDDKVEGLLPEPVPELQNIITQFSKEILSLKMSLLGSFFSTYFMPIHLDLLHSTIEHIIYTNAIKIQNFNKFRRDDWVDYIEGFDCNLKAENTYLLMNNKVGVTKKTMLGNHWKDGQDYEDVQLFGVDKLKDIKSVSEDELKTLWTQLYSGISAFVPVECTLKTHSKTDVLQQIQLTYMDKLLKLDKIFPAKNGIIKINFNILFKKALYEKLADGSLKEKPYNIGIKLILNTGKSYVRHFKIHICDTTYQNIEIYKLEKLNQDELNQVFKNGKNLNWNLFAFDNDPSIVPEDATIETISKTWYTQYITAKPTIANVGLTKQWQYKLFTNDIKLRNTLNYINHGVPYEETDLNIIREFLLKNIYIDSKGSKSLYNLFEDNKSNCFGDILLRPKYKLNPNDKDELRTYLFFLEKGYNKIQDSYDLFNFPNYQLLKNGIEWKCNFKLTKALNKDPYKFIYDSDRKLTKMKMRIDDEEYEDQFEFDTLTFKQGSNVEIELYADDLCIKEKTIINISPVDLITHQVISVPESLYVNGCYEGEAVDSYRDIIDVQDNLVESINKKIKYEEDLKFIPQFHKITKLEETEFKLTQSDIFCLIPNFYHTLTNGDIRWKIINDSSKQITIPKFKNNHFAKTLEPFALPYNPVNLEPGYYSIELNYSMDKTPITKKLNSRLFVEKNNIIYDLRDKHSDKY